MRSTRVGTEAGPCHRFSLALPSQRSRAWVAPAIVVWMRRVVFERLSAFSPWDGYALLQAMADKRKATAELLWSCQALVDQVRYGALESLSAAG
eukprot:6057626-Lingulodinium_polyedra.AAC.1